MEIDEKQFRSIMSKYPTGICIVTSNLPDLNPIGMTVGSFTSVSLDPLLVGFLPAKSSKSWPPIESSRGFCINVLAEGQHDVCKNFSGPAELRFANVDHSPSPGGFPRIAGAVAWIDCEQHSVTDAGDHWFVMGLVRALGLAEGERPLIFHEGGYARLAMNGTT